MFEDLTYNIILQRMLDRVPTNVDKREGSIIYDALAPAAFELMQMYFELNNIMVEAFADTASREFLIRRAAERGITPDPATNAILRGEFTPANIDMTRRRFSMPNSSIAYTVKDIISAGIYRVECETAGIQGNHYLGSIIPINHIQGLQTAELTDILIPAQDEEETEALRRRYLESYNDKAFGGNIRDYLNKTNTIKGVGATKVTPGWNGGGTVKLTILDSLYNPASPVLVDTVQAEIDPTGDHTGVGIAPIGHVVTVDTATAVPVNITTHFVFDVGYDMSVIQGQADELIQEYLLSLRKTWAALTTLIVRVTQIETRLLSITGVIDVSDTTINGVMDNLTLTNYEIPTYGGICPTEVTP